MTDEEFDALQSGDRVRTTNAPQLDTKYQLQSARVSSVWGMGAHRMVMIVFDDDGREITLCLPTSLERIKEDVQPLPLPG